MSIAERSVQTTWSGSLTAGSGVLGASSSTALDGFSVTWGSRTVRPDGKTSPEELAAAAHSSCFSMALALRLGEHGVTPDELRIVATVTLADVGGLPTITGSHLDVHARVPGMDAAGFATAVDEAAALCPISRLFAGAEVTVSAALDE